MEEIGTLLVAFMFITILTLGIAGLLTELAEVVRNVKLRHDSLLVGWAVLLLFAYFVLFWHTADITLIDEWDFWLFLFAESGPVLLLFATQILLGALSEQPESGHDQIVRQSRFFVMFGLVQLWSIAAGFVLGQGYGIASVLDTTIFVTCMALSFSTSRQFHKLGLAAIWLVYIAGAVIETTT